MNCRKGPVGSVADVAAPAMVDVPGVDITILGVAVEVPSPVGNLLRLDFFFVFGLEELGSSPLDSGSVPAFFFSVLVDRFDFLASSSSPVTRSRLWSRSSRAALNSIRVRVSSS